MTESRGKHREYSAPLACVDAVCDAFEAAWLAGQEPRIEDFLLGSDPAHEDALLRELLLAEWDLLGQRGHAALQTYYDRFPKTRSSISDLWRAWKDRQSETMLSSPPIVSGTTRYDAHVERLGARFNHRYRLLEKLGEGGFGVVWAAEQQEPVKRHVALKVVKLGMDTKQVVARFEAERQALALMDHPNIAQVFDAGATESGRPYFVMELVRGIPITTYCDQERLSTQSRLDLFMKVCHAIQHAHQKGIIHRDIKPSNILVTPHDGVGVPKVIDFGIAKVTQGSLAEKKLYTQVQQFIGTPAYMSPEQAEMSELDIDTRSDVYSLGVFLYELLTGTTPFDTERLRTAAFDEMRRVIREEEPPCPSRRISSLAYTPHHTVAGGRLDSREPGQRGRFDDLTTIASRRQTEPRKLSRLFRGELDWIVMKALEKDRRMRYQTASALAADVLRYLRNETVVACPPTLGYRLRKIVRRHRGSVLAASLVLLALVGGMIGTTWQMIRATEARAVAVNEAKQRAAALATARQSEQAATDRLFLALWNQARAGRFSRQLGQRLNSLRALSQAARIRPDQRLRDEAIAAMTLPDVRQVPIPYAFSPETTAVAFGGAFDVYARADKQGVISIRRVRDDQEVQKIASGPILGNYLFFSSDSQFLLALSEGYALGVWRVADGRRAIRDGLRECRAHAFSPDGRRLAIGQQARVVCFDLATGNEVNRWELPAQVHSLAFHPDGSQLAVGYFRSNVISIYDLSDSTLLTELPVGLIHDQVVCWHPNGDRLAVVGSDPRIQIWSVVTNQKLATLEGHVQYVETLTFHPDGALLASHSWDGVLRLWDVATGRTLLHFPHVLGSRPHFSRDGRWLGVVLGSEKADLLEVTPSHEYRTLASSSKYGTGGYNGGDFSPDGRLLAVAMDAGTRFWELSSGRELAALPPWTNFVYFGDVSGTGDPSGISPDARQRAGRLSDILTCGLDGLLRWPVTCEEPDGRHLRLGPPRRLLSATRATFTPSADGGSLAAVTRDGSRYQILGLEAGTVRRDLGEHPDGEVCDLSRNGRWAATCGWHSDRVRLWNADTGQMVHEWILGKRARVFFTPDSRVLIISRGDEFSFWDVTTRQPVRRLRRDVALYPGHVAFSPDGQLMAVEMAPAIIHLKEVATGRTVAKLEDPHGDRATWQGFTPDGTQLVVVASYSTAIHIWDLRSIRARLKVMNLDWDWPDFPPAANRTLAAESLSMEVDRGDLDKPAVTRERRAIEAIARYRRDVEVKPDSAASCNALAWALVTAPETLRIVEEAVPLAEKAVRLDSGDADYRNTLGVAYYRAGRYREAVDILRPNVSVQEDSALAFDLYFLAMSHHRLGNVVLAKDHYDLAVRWTNAHNSLSDQDAEVLATFRAETEELLEIERDE